MSTNDESLVNLPKDLHLNFDLSTDYLHRTNVKKLQKLCILNVVINAFRSKEVIEEINKKLPSSVDNILTIENTDKIFSIVEKKVEISYWPKYYVKEVLLNIRLVYTEINIFLLKINERDRSEMLKNLIFNWQGTINPRETFLQVLKNCKLSNKEKFEFSCTYLFDEQIIKTYFYELSLEIRNWYISGGKFLEFERDLFIYFWIWKITGNNESFRELYKTCVEEMFENDDEELLENDEEVNIIYFMFKCCLKFSNEIGVQYLIENYPFCKERIFPSINLLLKNSFQIPVTNILMFLIIQLDVDTLELVKNDCANFILSSLIMHPRWHDIFIIFYIMLLNHIEFDDYFVFFIFVIKNIWNMIKIEGTDGIYADMLRYFIKLVPLQIKEDMRFKHEKDFAKLITKLLCFEEVESVYLLLSKSVNKDGVFDIGNNFYILALFNLNVLVEAFRYCSDNFRDMALKKLVKSKKQITFLKKQIYIKVRQSSRLKLQ